MTESTSLAQTLFPESKRLTLDLVLGKTNTVCLPEWPGVPTEAPGNCTSLLLWEARASFSREPGDAQFLSSPSAHLTQCGGEQQEREEGSAEQGLLE